MSDLKFKNKNKSRLYRDLINLDFFDLHQVTYLLDHPHDLGGLFMNDAMADPAKAERLDRIFLSPGSIYRAFDLRNLNLGHRSDSLEYGRDNILYREGLTIK